MTITDISTAAEAIRRGELVALPTETVYGLGGDATNTAAVAKIYQRKRRPVDHPLIVHLCTGDELSRWAADVPSAASELGAALWPGPLTMVLRRHERLPPAAAGGLDTVGLRVPDHPVALALIEACDVPIAAPSANRFGRVSPTSAEDVAAEFGPDLLLLDGGDAVVGVESTIVDLTGDLPLLLRPGGVPVELIEEILGRRVHRRPPLGAKAPGLLTSHYAPTAAVELVDSADVGPALARHLEAGRRVALLTSVVAELGDLKGEVLVLDVPGSNEDYARSLYRHFRRADLAGVDVLLAVPPDGSGLGLAIRDRLLKAAAPRP